MQSSKLKIEESWKQVLSDQFEKPYFDSLVNEVKLAYHKYEVFPPGKHIFRALNVTPLHGIRVVILGQDPYHGPGQANGLCFSVGEGVPFPPSLLNIFKELSRDLKIPIPKSGDLEPWARQGVMLLNATLTVRAHEAGSHQGIGWEQFTDSVIQAINTHREHVVFMLWGAYARKKALLIDQSKHLVLESPHPSPLSAHRGFFGNGHFGKANAYLMAKGIQPVDWRL